MPEGRYNFGSPGAAAGNAIQEFLMQRELQQRDQMERAFRERQAKDQADRAQQQLMLEAERERRIAEQQRTQQADLDTEREFRRATTIANAALPDDPVDAITAELLKRHGYGGQIREGQPTQGAYLGDDESMVPQYDVVPGILQLRGGSQYLNARAQAEERAAQAAAAREDAAERARLDREARRDVAQIMAAGRENRPGNISDYEQFLRRWTRDRGIDVERMTADQELEARKGYFAAGRAPGLGEFLDDLDGGAAPPAPAPAPRPSGGGRSGGAGAGRTATTADIRAVAQRAGITEAEARRRLEAEGVVVR